MKKNTVKGVIFAHFETGAEGLVWSLLEDGKNGYDALHILEAGDYLTIFSKGGLRIFSDTIKPNYKIGRKRITGTNNWQPVALGCWIHWTQSGFLPDDWAKFFTHSPALRAELRKK